jgi:hypothetical protein
MINIIRHNDVDDDGNRIPALGRCHCGNLIELWYDESCDKCGRMYNSAGQELRTMSYEDEPGEDY